MSGNERRYEFPMTSLDASTQSTKIIKPKLLLNECAQVPTKGSKVHFDPANEIKKSPSEKSDHHPLLKLKRLIQNLIDFQSPRIALKEIPTNDFTKNIRISQNFQLIALDGEPVPELMLCKRCFQVRARGRLSSTPIVRHLKNHEKVDMTRKNEEKKKGYKNNNAMQYASSLYQAMNNSAPLSLAAQENGNNLSRPLRLAIEQTILSQGEPEAQIKLCKNLKRVSRKKINLEHSELKKKQNTPIEENSLASQPICIEPETTQSPNMKLNEITKALPCVKDTSIPVNLSNHEMIDDHAMEKISIAHDEKEELITSPSPIAENEITLEIHNDSLLAHN